MYKAKRENIWLDLNLLSNSTYTTHKYQMKVLDLFQESE